MEYFSAADDTDDADLLAAQLKEPRHLRHLRLKNVIVRMETSPCGKHREAPGSAQN